MDVYHCAGLYYLAHPHVDVLCIFSSLASLSHRRASHVLLEDGCINFLKESERAYPQALPVLPSDGRVRQT